MINPLENKQGATVSAYDIDDVSPNDTYEFDEVFRGIWVGTGGNLAIITLTGKTRIITGIQSGTLLPLLVKTIKFTGTTAAGIQVWR